MRGQCKDQKNVDSYEHVQPRIEDHSKKMYLNHTNINELSFSGSIMKLFRKESTVSYQLKKLLSEVPSNYENAFLAIISVRGVNKCDTVPVRIQRIREGRWGTHPRI